MIDEPDERFLLRDDFQRGIAALGPFGFTYDLVPWAAGLRELAACPNVYCKLSGLVFRADWQRWRPEDFGTYLDVALELFGPMRLMVGSNWPVCTVAGDYDTDLDIVLDRVRTLSEAEQAQILGKRVPTSTI